ncbi:MAG: hypothetical protein OCD76_10590 [Reichenbachiella sp.]
MRRLITLLFIVIYPALKSYSQIGNKGVPIIKNYTYEDYQAGANNWDVLQDKNGYMLFGNNYGLLQYSGKDWSLIVQPTNKTIIRSLYKSKNDTVFLGAQNDFGYVKTNNSGEKRFTSLKEKIALLDREFSDVWDIKETTKGVFFQTDEGIYQYVNDTITFLRAVLTRGMSKVGDSLMVQDNAFNILSISNSGFRKIIDGNLLQSPIKTIIDNHHNGLILLVQKKGVFSYEKGVLLHEAYYINQFFEKNKITSVHRFRNNYLALGTESAGILFLDNDLMPIQLVDKSKGLQSNSISAMNTDKTGNLWVTSENGIDYIQIATPLYQISDHYKLEGAVAQTLLYDDILYVANSTGLYSSLWKQYENPLEPTLDFSKIEDISGQVWQLYSIDDLIYVCHSGGLSVIREGKIKNIFDESGSWNLIPVNQEGKYYLQGAYDGIYLFENKNGALKYLWKVRGFEETSRIIQIDDKGNIWMAHGYKGMYKLNLSEDKKSFDTIKLYTKDHGFPTSLFINLFKIKSKIIFGTEHGAYQYDYVKDTMVPEPLYMKIFGDKQHIRFLQEEADDVWYITGQDMKDKMGIIDFYENDEYELITPPLQQLRGRFNPGFENIKTISPGITLFGLKNGLVLYDRNINRNYGKPYHTVLTEVQNVVTDSLVFGQQVIDNQTAIKPEVDRLKLKYGDNSLRFTFANDFYENTEETMYCSYLEGLENHWSPWNKEQVKTYSFIPPGHYVFRAKSKNIYGMESSEVSYSFQILGPWYLSLTFKIIYAVLFLLLIYSLLRLYRKRIEWVQIKERNAQQVVLKKSKVKYQEEKLLAEKEIIALRNEKLEAEVIVSQSKMEVLDTELAASIMMITQKNSVLIKVRDDMNSLLKKAKDSNRGDINQVIKLINQDIDTEQDWNQFKIHFDKIYENFLERLKTEYPTITPKDLQLAAYLRLNLSSKEISSMMNITVRSVEGCRYRLRKQLKLDSNTNLNNFIVKY